ncbi:MAG: single-stranded DNA-binding protein [Treponema sp.]|nr:single-stranded DNA-binding protein [Spirochaetia bacterium]MDY4525205.1 single-stranded DNA-binding protein [Treponema sp.]MDY5683153.1 single-stranded DNA-binding protein [Treponema sp.]
MSDFNKSFVMGRLVRNAETKTTSEGLFIAHFSIANNQSKKNQDGTWGETVYYFDFSLYGKRAEALAPYLVQGQLVAIEAHLIQRRWEKDGKKFSKLEIAVDDIQLVSRPNSKNEGNELREIETKPLEAQMYSGELPAEEMYSEPKFTEEIY